MAEIKTPTPHIAARRGEIAETILLPGDPLRAKYIADHFLEDAVQFNATRNMFGFTGTYRGKPVSVMGTGMGCPSIGIYSYELIHAYGCKNLIRVGTAGAMQPHVKIRDMVFGMGACTDSRYVRQFRLARRLFLHLQLRASGEGRGGGPGEGAHLPRGKYFKLRRVLQPGSAPGRKDLGRDGRAGRGDGGGGPLRQRRGGGR